MTSQKEIARKIDQLEKAKGFAYGSEVAQVEEEQERLERMLEAIRMHGEEAVQECECLPEPSVPVCPWCDGERYTVRA